MIFRRSKRSFLEAQRMSKVYGTESVVVRVVEGVVIVKSVGVLNVGGAGGGARPDDYSILEERAW